MPVAMPKAAMMITEVRAVKTAEAATVKTTKAAVKAPAMPACVRRGFYSETLQILSLKLELGDENAQQRSLYPRSGSGKQASRPI
jgi:hypothetical protein